LHGLFSENLFAGDGKYFILPVVFFSLNFSVDSCDIFFQYNMAKDRGGE